jgi:hypothetical protein
MEDGRWRRHKARMEDGGWFFTADDADGADKGLLFAGIFLNGQPDSGINTGQDARLSGRLEACPTGQGLDQRGMSLGFGALTRIVTIQVDGKVPSARRRRMRAGRPRSPGT